MDHQVKKVAKNLRFVESEIQHINDEKYFEGERIKNDPGNDFVEKWVTKYAKDYREAWEKSKCSSCKNWKKCGKEVKLFCEHFSELEEGEETA